jgi:DNA repair exonuclease SbcCD ATPase subunit
MKLLPTYLPGFSLCAGLALALVPSAASAQRQPESTDSAELEVTPMPDWSIREEVNRLDTSMQEYNTLIDTLGRASTDLGQEFEAYLADPNNEELASEVEFKMAQYAQRVMGNFDQIIADQDVLGTNFRELRRKLRGFSGHLASQAEVYNERLQGYRGNAREIEERLTQLSVQLKENPPEDPNELRLLRREFSREFRRYRLQTRYVNGYQRRYENYQGLQGNMERLAELFVGLHDRFNELIENLEHERQYLEDSMRLQADSLRIKQLMRDGIYGSENAIGNVASKLEDLYSQVDAFTQVHERINVDLDQFVESQSGLVDIMRRIDRIGTSGGPIGDIAADMDLAIDAFYDRRFADPEEELLGVESTEEDDQ